MKKTKSSKKIVLKITMSMTVGGYVPYGTNSKNVLWLFYGRLIKDHSLVRISMGPPFVLLHQVRDLYGRDHTGLLVLNDFLTSGNPLSSQNHSGQLPQTQLLHHSHSIRPSNHSRQLP